MISNDFFGFNKIYMGIAESGELSTSTGDPIQWAESGLKLGYNLLTQNTLTLQHHLLSTLNTNVYVNWHILPYTTGSHCRQVDISPEKERFGNMRIITSISVVS